MPWMRHRDCDLESGEVAWGASTCVGGGWQQGQPSPVECTPGCERQHLVKYLHGGGVLVVDLQHQIAHAKTLESGKHSTTEHWPLATGPEVVVMLCTQPHPFSQTGSSKLLD